MNAKTKFKAGQTVWDIRNGRGVIIDIEQEGTYPVNVKYDLKDKYGHEIFDSFTLDGRYTENQKVRSLYLSEPKIIAETEPPFEPELKKGDGILVTHFGKSFIIKVQKETEDRIFYNDEGHYWPKDNTEVKFYKLPEVQLITFD